jgi:CO/xanthine dehydrogenase Mo-binding subunit
VYEEHYKEDPYTKEKYPQSIYHDAPQQDLKWVGNKTLNRIGAEPKVMGQDKMGNDQVWPHQLYLKVKRCPHSHAVVTSIDTTAAKALPGVVMVLTHDDVPDLIARAPYSYCLNKECWTDGHAVAAVAATEESIAEEAIDLIEVEYDVLPFVIHGDDAIKDDYVLHGDTNEVGTPWTHDIRGDVEAGFAEAGVTTVEGHYSSVTRPFYGEAPVAPFENESTSCSWENDRLICYISTQNPWGDSRTIASNVGLPQNRIVARHTLMGCGFGRKGSDQAGQTLAGYVSMKTHRPVKWLQDNWGYFGPCRSTWQSRVHDIKTGVKDDGTLVAYENKCVVTGGYLGGRGGQSGMAPIPFRWQVPNLYLEAHDVWTNTMGNGIPR